MNQRKNKQSLYDDITDEEVLKYALEHGTVDLVVARADYKMRLRKEYLDMHCNKIWEGKDSLFYTYLGIGNNRKLKRRPTKREIEDCVVAYYKAQENDPFMDGVITMWLDEKYQLYHDISKQTHDKYRNNYRRYFTENKCADTIRSKKLRLVSEDELEVFIRRSISDMNLTRKSYSDMMILIRGIFRYGKKHKFTDLSITHFVGDLEISRNAFAKKIKSKEKEVFTEDETTVVTNYLKETGRIRELGLLLLFQTGLRVGELSALKKQDITEIKYVDEKTNRNRFEVRDFPKTDAGCREVFINKSAHDTLSSIMELTDETDYLFSENGKRICENAFRRKLARVCDTLGIPQRSPHKIRKTYGTMLIDGDVDESIITEQMGHCDIATTKQYYYYSNKADKKKLDQIQKAVVI